MGSGLQSRSVDSCCSDVVVVVKCGMATDVNTGFYGLGREELPDRHDSQEASVSKMLDHGSISFGRFAFESLEWERRSVFSHNKCQEELEKFKSPGLVAQKKAYFEEYYKKIRALKAMKENQQTNLSLDYGSNCSISSQTGEDETVVKIESLGDVASSIVDAYSKEASAEKKQNNEAVKLRHVDFEPALSTLDSSTKVSVGINQEKSNMRVLQMEHLDSGSTVLESLIRTEEIEQLDHNNFDDKGISSKHVNSESTAKQEKNSSGSVHIQHIESMDRQQTDHKSLIGTKVIDGLYYKEITRKTGNLEPPVLVTGGSVLHLTNPDAVKSDCNISQEKAKSTVRKHKDHMPVTKGPAASARNGLKSEPNVHTYTKPFQAPKYPSQMANNKTKNSVSSSNKTSDRVSRNYRSTPVTSHKPLTEVRSNATTPRPPITSQKPLTEVHSNATTSRPFSFAAERRSAAPADSRDSAPILHSKPPKRLATSLNQANDVRNKQDTSIKTARTCGVKCKGSENKRSSEKVRDSPLLTSRMGKGVNLPEPSKARISRPVNLPAWNHSNPHGANEHRSNNGLRKDKQKVVESSRANPLTHKGRMALSGGMPCNGAKTRQEMPHWR